MKVYQRLASDFVAEGVTHMFGIMGDGNMYWMHELDKLGGVQDARGAPRGRRARHGRRLGARDAHPGHCHRDLRAGRVAARHRADHRQPRFVAAGRLLRRISRRTTTNTTSASTRRRSPPAARPASSASPSPGGRGRVRAQGVLPRQARVAPDHAERADGRAADGVRGRRRAVQAVSTACCRSACVPRIPHEITGPPTSSARRSTR